MGRVKQPKNFLGWKTLEHSLSNSNSLTQLSHSHRDLGINGNGTTSCTQWGRGSRAITEPLFAETETF